MGFLGFARNDTGGNMLFKVTHFRLGDSSASLENDTGRVVEAEGKLPAVAAPSLGMTAHQRVQAVVLLRGCPRRQILRCTLLICCR